MPGATSTAASDFVLNASPTSTPAHTSQLNRPESIAPNAAQHAASANRISSESTPFSRDTATNDGNTASANAPTSPAVTPNRGATIRYSSSTASTAQRPSGSIRLAGAKPNTFALNACNHSAS